MSLLGFAQEDLGSFVASMRGTYLHVQWISCARDLPGVMLQQDAYDDVLPEVIDMFLSFQK